MDMGSESAMFASLIFSSIGVGYFIYGKKQAQFIMLGTGMALMIYPYAVSGAGLIVLIGVALMALPFLLARLS